MSDQKQNIGLDNSDPVKATEQMIELQRQVIDEHQRLAETESDLWIICGTAGLNEGIQTDQLGMEFVLGYPYPDQQQSGSPQPCIRLHRSAKLEGKCFTYHGFEQAERDARQIRLNGIKCRAIAAHDWHTEQIAGSNHLIEVLQKHRQEMIEAQGGIEQTEDTWGCKRCGAVHSYHVAECRCSEPAGLD